MFQTIHIMLNYGIIIMRIKIAKGEMYMQLNIFVCDDDAVQVDLLTRFINLTKSIYEFSIIASSSGEELLSKINKIVPDVVFLDIQMKELNGIDTGIELRRRFKDVILVYVTGYKDYALNAFEAKSFDYIIKPITIEHFNRIMGDIIIRAEQIKLHEEKNQMLYINSKNTNVALRYREVIYFEKLLRKINIITLSCKHEYWGSLKELIHTLNRKIFVQCHQGYIVNRHMIKGLQGDELLLHNTDAVIPVSRRYKQFIKSIFEEGLFD